MHDLILVDSPKFHIVFDFAVNLEVYHLTIRGANLGSYDGVDVVGTNYWVHDIEVTNRDECVSVKSPSNHALVENLVCNQAGSGISIGSLNVSASIANIVGPARIALRPEPGLTHATACAQHQHHPGQQHCLYQDVSGRLWLRDQCDV